VDADRPFDFSEAPAPPAGVSSFLVKPGATAFAELAQRLIEGGLVAIPTETVYGLAGIATDPRACENIFRLKGRPLLDPLIVHVRNLRAAEEVAVFNEAAHRLAEACWPGALTMVLPKRGVIPPIITAGRETVAVRAPSHPDFQALAEAVRRPLAAPSANPFGYISPTRAEHVLQSFPEAGLAILDGGPCAIGLESTIIDLSHPERPRLLRAGHFTGPVIEAIIGRPVAGAPIPSSASPIEERGLPAPGMLPRHYSPHTACDLRESFSADPFPGPGTVRVHYQRPAAALPGRDYWLTEDGQAGTAGRGLYALLRQLDADPVVREILIEQPPARADTEALRDRLRRACAQ
jgi:L-threonylcarbamoyladenylate synthase